MPAPECAPHTRAVFRKMHVAAIVVSAILLSVGPAACSGDQGKKKPAHAGRDGGDAAVAAGEGDAAASAPEGAAEPYRLAPVDDEGEVEKSGRLSVVVSWPEPPPEVLQSPGLNACGVAVRSPASFFIRTKKSDVTGLRHAVVSLSGVERGRRPDPAEATLIAVRDCRLRPVVARVARLGGRLAVVNDDERRHQVVLERLGEGGEVAERLARVPLPLVGGRYDLPLEEPGFYRATTAGSERDHSYVVVPPHPYVAVADERGLARMDQVPAGTYEVVAWHPPLERGGAPLTARGEVEIEAGGTTRHVIELKP